MAGRGMLWPAVLTMVAFAAALLLSAAYTSYAISAHARETCPELRTEAFAGPPHLDPYDAALRRAHRLIYDQRCR